MNRQIPIRFLRVSHDTPYPCAPAALRRLWHAPSASIFPLVFCLRRLPVAGNLVACPEARSCWRLHRFLPPCNPHNSRVRRRLRRPRSNGFIERARSSLPSHDVGRVKSFYVFFCSLFFALAHTPSLTPSRAPVRRLIWRAIANFHSSPTYSLGPCHFIDRCCPPNISPVTEDHDDLFELPAVQRGG